MIQSSAYRLQYVDNQLSIATIQPYLSKNQPDAYSETCSHVGYIAERSRRQTRRGKATSALNRWRTRGYGGSQRRRLPAAFSGGQRLPLLLFSTVKPRRDHLWDSIQLQSFSWINSKVSKFKLPPKEPGLAPISSICALPSATSSSLFLLLVDVLLSFLPSIDPRFHVVKKLPSPRHFPPLLSVALSIPIASSALVDISLQMFKKQTVFFLQTADVWSTSSSIEDKHTNGEDEFNFTNLQPII
ncbi:hypothetical protein LXL04_004672 [Taraxacum kok-saghyz]